MAHTTVKVAFFNDNNQILFVRENGKKRHAWYLPGGGMDGCESLADTAKRELQEETNLQARQISKPLPWSDNGKDHCLYLAIALGPKGEMRPGDNALECRWFSKDEVLTNKPVKEARISERHREMAIAALRRVLPKSHI